LQDDEAATQTNHIFSSFFSLFEFLICFDFIYISKRKIYIGISFPYNESIANSKREYLFDHKRFLGGVFYLCMHIFANIPPVKINKQVAKRKDYPFWTLSL